MVFFMLAKQSKRPAVDIISFVLGIMLALRAFAVAYIHGWVRYPFFRNASVTYLAPLLVSYCLVAYFAALLSSRLLETYFARARGPERHPGYPNTGVSRALLIAFSAIRAVLIAGSLNKLAPTGRYLALYRYVFVCEHCRLGRLPNGLRW
jgi:hypothetical protein